MKTEKQKYLGNPNSQRLEPVSDKKVELPLGYETPSTLEQQVERLVGSRIRSMRLQELGKEMETLDEEWGDEEDEIFKGIDPASIYELHDELLVEAERKGAMIQEAAILEKERRRLAQIAGTPVPEPAKPAAASTAATKSAPKAAPSKTKEEKEE